MRQDGSESAWNFIVCMFICFFFYSLGHHRDLHSFPTRRSSDLTSGVRVRRGRFRVGFAVSTCTPQPTRSEEHTSELQSRFDLVCRLLLEKKKALYFAFRVSVARQ